MYASIDIGSNTVQLLICQAKDGLLSKRTNYVRTTRLGKMDEPGILTDVAMENTAAVVREYMELCANAGVQQVRMTGTSAVRDAKNSDALKQIIKNAVPAAPELEILAGTEEAALSWAGAKASIGFPADFVVVDVGGSSSEMIVRDASGCHGVSANMGAVRAAEAGWGRDEIRRRLEHVFGRTTPAGVVGVGGTITTAAGWKLALSAYDRASIENVVISKDELETLTAKLEPLSLPERCALSPLFGKRGEILLHGLYIWLSVLELTASQQVTVTAGGLPDGAVAQMAFGDKAFE